MKRKMKKRKYYENTHHRCERQAWDRTELRCMPVRERRQSCPQSCKRATVLATDVDTRWTSQTATRVAAYVRHHAPDAIISCAAFTNVDGCETNREAAFAVNAWVRATWPARRSAQAGGMSPRTMFGGDAAQPVWEYDLPAPRSVYGKQSCWASSMYSSSARTISLCCGVAVRLRGRSLSDDASSGCRTA